MVLGAICVFLIRFRRRAKLTSLTDWWRCHVVQTPQGRMESYWLDPTWLQPSFFSVLFVIHLALCELPWWLVARVPSNERPQVGGECLVKNAAMIIFGIQPRQQRSVATDGHRFMIEYHISERHCHTQHSSPLHSHHYVMIYFNGILIRYSKTYCLLYCLTRTYIVYPEFFWGRPKLCWIDHICSWTI